MSDDDKKRLEARCDELEKEIVRLAHLRDELSKRATEHNSQLEALVTENATLTRESAGLAVRRGSLMKLAAWLLKARDEQTRRAAEYSAELERLKLQLAKNDAQFRKNESGAKLPDEISKVAPRIKVLARLDLGSAWAANTINTVIFRHHGIFTDGGQQYTAFYVDEHTLRLIQRDLSAGTVIAHDILGNYNLRDAHNSISLGLDRAGHLHISYDHHATQLRYRRSVEPWSIAVWTDELQMTGVNEDRVTYPTFILPRNNHPLTLLYRDGWHNKGSAHLKTYDEATQSWSDHTCAILSGAEQKPWTSNAYWNHPAIDRDGGLHLSFVWRTDTLGEEERINNINIGYARSRDNGLTWETSQARPYKLPITQVNAETVWPVSPGSNLINQTSMAVDSQSRPHIVFYSDDPDGVPQYQHLWFDRKVWRHQFISNRKAPFSLLGGGTLRIPISRPDIVLDRRDNAYVIYRGDLTHNRMAASVLPAPDYAYHPANSQMLWKEDLGYAEPVIDRTRWARDQVLTLLLQRNEQPDHDLGHQRAYHDITVLDLSFG